MQSINQWLSRGGSRRSIFKTIFVQTGLNAINACPEEDLVAPTHLAGRDICTQLRSNEHLLEIYHENTVLSFG